MGDVVSEKELTKLLQGSFKLLVWMATGLRTHDPNKVPNRVNVGSSIPVPGEYFVGEPSLPKRRVPAVRAGTEPYRGVQ